MKRARFTRIAARLALRDLRRAPRTPILVAIAVAVSVASTSAVAGLGVALEKSLSGDLRTWLGGDISVLTFDPPNEEQTALLARLDHDGVQSTTVIVAPANATSDQSPDASMLLLKFVEPEKYPYYGRLTLVSHAKLRETLADDTAVLSADAAAALKVVPGDDVRVAGEKFRVAAIVESEPDRLAGTPPVLGPHALLTLGSLSRTGIGRTALLHYRILFRLPSGAAPSNVRAQIERAFADTEVLDYREPSQQASDILEGTLVFLRAMALLALPLGSLAAASAIRLHLADKLDSIAILRTLGARSSQIQTIYLFEAGLLAIAGCTAGLVAAALVQRRLAASLQTLMPLSSRWMYEPRIMLAGAALVLVAIVVTVLPQILAACRIRPAEILRRNPRYPNELPSAMHLSAATVAVAPGVVLARWLMGSWMLALIIAGILITVALVVYAVVTLFRPRSKGMVLTFAVGIVVMVSAAAGRQSLATEILHAFPHSDWNLMVLGVLRGEQPAVAAFIEQQPGVVARTKTVALAWLRLVSVDGRAIAALDTPTGRVNRMWLASCEPGSSLNLRMDSDIARRLGAHLGSSVEFSGNARRIVVHVVATQAVPPAERIWYGLSFDCVAFDGQNTVNHVLARVRPGQLHTVLQALHARFPKLTVISTASLFVYLDDAARKAADIVEVMSILVIAAGTLVLIAVLAAEQSSHRYEIAIFKVLGAGRRKLLFRLSTEFARSGLLAALIGAPLGWAAASIALSIFLQRWVLAFHWLPLLAAIPLAILAANLAGWAVSYRLLDAKPTDLIRE